MDHLQFHIGLEFWCAGKRWRCTDVSSRVIVAISLEPQEVVSFEFDPLNRASLAEPTERRILTEDPVWSSGPPYTCAECVFDENDVEACSLAFE